MPFQFAKLYEAVARASQPCELPEGWGWLTPAADCLQLEDPSATFESLAAEFPEAELVGSRIAGRLGPVLTVNVHFAMSAGGFVVLRDLRGDPFELVIAGDCLSGNVPSLEMLHDKATQAALDRTNRRRMYVTFDPNDTMLLRSLRVAVAPGARLINLNHFGLKSLASLVAAADEWHDAGNPAASLELVLVAGSVSELTAEVPASLTEAARHIHGGEAHAGLRFPGIHVWHPTPNDLDGLDYLRRLESSEAAGDFFRQRCQPRHRLSDFLTPGPPPAKKFDPAQGYLRQLAEKPPAKRDLLGINYLLSTPKPKPAGPSYEKIIDQFLVQPFVARAMETNDPEQRALDLQLAITVKLLLLPMPAIVEAVRQARDDLMDPEGALLSPELFKQFMALQEQLTELISKRRKF